MEKRLSLVKKFILYSFIAFFIVSGSLTVILSYFMKSNTETLELILIIWITMFIGLISLYVFLFRSVYSTSNALVQQNSELIESKEQIEEVLEKLKHSYRETVSAASAAIDARDSYTAGHSRRVADIACRIGRELGLEGERIECLELAALFHDIGKIGVPDRILNKPGSLDEEEFKRIKMHPVMGYEILGNIEFLSDMLPAVLYHHERPDGKGYPEGLTGDKIPIGASIIAIADAYDAMTTDRPYQSALSHELAVEEIKRLSGIQFKKEVVDAFLKTDN